MKAKFLMKPFPHVLLSDFYTEGEMIAVLDEKRKLDPVLQPPGMTGTARHPSTNQPLKFNDGMFLTEMFPGSEIVQVARKHIFHELVDQIDCDWWTTVWKRNNKENWMLSR